MSFYFNHSDDVLFGDLDDNDSETYEKEGGDNVTTEEDDANRNKLIGDQEPLTDPLQCRLGKRKAWNSTNVYITFFLVSVVSSLSFLLRSQRVGLIGVNGAGKVFNCCVHCSFKSF